MCNEHRAEFYRREGPVANPICEWRPYMFHGITEGGAYAPNPQTMALDKVS